MAFYSGFFNSKGLDRTYTAEDFTSYLSSIICNGILDTYGQMFKLTAASSGLKVNLGTGKAWINGQAYRLPLRLHNIPRNAGLFVMPLCRILHGESQTAHRHF